MIGNVVLSYVDPLMCVILRMAEKHMTYEKLLGTYE